MDNTSFKLDQTRGYKRLVETHIFCFVVGREFVTSIEKLKISSKTIYLDVAKVLKLFTKVTKAKITKLIDKQSLLDLGIL